MFLAAAVTSGARVLDNFDAAARAGWEDTNPGGLPLKGGEQANGRFTFNLPPVGQPFFVSSTKTSETFELREGRTLECRVDMVSGLGVDSFAVMGFIPQATGPNTLGGYGIAKSESDILITKGINKYFYNENVNPPVKNANVTLVLNLAVRGGAVHVTGQVLDKDDGNRVLWERSYVDTTAADVMSDGEDSPAAPFVNLPGNFVLYLYADGGKDPAGYQVVYDNAEVLVTESAVLDDFNASARAGWEDSNPAGLPLKGGEQGNGVFTFDLPAIGQSFFVNSKKSTTTYELAEGTRHEFSVDFVSGRGPDSFVVLAWIPLATGPNTLAGYGIAKSESDVLITKGINKYFYNENAIPPIKNTNVRLTLTLTVAGGNVIIRGRILDKEDADKVLFDKTFVDTAAADVLSDGTDSPAAPFITSGNVVLYLYADGGTSPEGYQVVLDNLVVAAPPAAANAPPVVSGIAPAPGGSFLPASTQLTFSVGDDAALPDSGISVVLNGTTYTTANGLTLGGTPTARTATLGGFVANSDYSGEIRIRDAGGIERTATVFFDTFSATTRVVEVEDYNFESGGYFNTPVRTAEFGGAADNSYTDRMGTSGVDFSDTRTAPRTQDSMYRTMDPVRMAHTLDRRRAAYDNDAGIFDYDVGDLAAGEWMNYTRDFTAGTYQIYLRESVVNLAQADSVLEQVTSSPSEPDQTVRSLGTFPGRTSGFTHRNVPLSDGAGKPVTVRLSGRTTLRLRTVTADTDSGNRYLNYLVFLPVADTGPQRATIAASSPAPGATVESVTPSVEVTIQNRDTTVNLSTLKVTFNGAEVAAKVTATADGATVSYPISPLPASGSNNSVTVSFKDSDGQDITSSWQFVLSYASLDPASRVAGTGKTRGFKLRVVQAPADGGPLENSLDRAENQLGTGSSIPRAVDVSTNAPTINFNKRAGAVDGYFEGDVMVPGIDPDVTGNGDLDFAVEIVTWLELPAGVHRFGARTDDGYKVASAVAPVASTTPLAFHNGGPADETFEFVVPQAGLYPFRMVWYERGGGGHAEWFSVDPATGTRTLINDATASGAIKAWSEIVAAPVEIVVESAASITGPWAAEAGAVVNATTKTASVTASGNQRFYRIRSGSALRLLIIRAGNPIVIGW